MIPFHRGGPRPPEFLVFLLICWLSGAGVAQAGSSSAVSGTQERTPAADPGAAVPERLALALSMGQAKSSALPAGGVGFWSAQARIAPFATRLGLSAELRVDALAQNQPGGGWNLRLDSQGVEYGLSLGFAPTAFPVGFEYHRLDGSSLPAFQSTARGAGHEYVIDGGASHLYGLGHSGRHHRLRVGYGHTGRQANAAPYLLGLHGYLPSPRRAEGPFATLTAERLRLFGFVGRAGAMFILDQRGDRPYSGDFLAWGATLHRSLGERIILGASYVGANSSVRNDHLSSMFSLYLRLRWSHQPTHRS